MRTYKLSFRSGSMERRATSLREAIATARRVLGADRLFKGAEYVTDEPAGGDERRSVEAMDLWESRTAAKTQQGVSADCVITWELKS